MLLSAAPQVEPDEGPEFAEIRGVVVDASSGEALNKVEVTLSRLDPSRERPLRAGVNEKGEFTFIDVQPGRYRLTAERNGYTSVKVSIGGSSRSVGSFSVSAGDLLGGVALRLSRSAVVVGRVLDEDGEPLQDATVTLVQVRYLEGDRMLSPVGRPVLTNDLGEYRLYDIVPGGYFIRTELGGNCINRFGFPVPPGDQCGIIKEVNANALGGHCGHGDRGVRENPVLPVLPDLPVERCNIDFRGQVPPTCPVPVPE